MVQVKPVRLNRVSVDNWYNVDLEEIVKRRPWRRFRHVDLVVVQESIALELHAWQVEASSMGVCNMY